MAYFLKKSKQQNRTYLAIYESFYSPDSNDTRHKCVGSLGSVESLIAKVNIKMLESGQNNNVGKPTFLFCPY